ncbi:MAG: gamma-glutamylcyclotransferase [Spirochaetes bacterium]|nr:MAG: gamma-glutamylcyclotransferase [Spirochaetota bacterium]
MTLHKLFVYGSLKRGFGNHRFLSESTFLATTTTADPAYSMLSLGAFPAVVDGGVDMIQGELYEVDDNTLAQIDMLEGNGRFYERFQVLLSNGEVAWMYHLVGATALSHGSEMQTSNGIAVWEDDFSNYINKWRMASE